MFFNLNLIATTYEFSHNSPTFVVGGRRMKILIQRDEEHECNIGVYLKCDAEDASWQTSRTVKWQMTVKQGASESEIGCFKIDSRAQSYDFEREWDSTSLGTGFGCPSMVKVPFEPSSAPAEAAQRAQHKVESHLAVIPTGLMFVECLFPCPPEPAFSVDAAAVQRCKNAHVLVRLEKCPYLSGWGCDRCSRHIPRETVGVWHCATCKYDVCPSCSVQKAA
jgi:hypothetical protein